MKNTKTIKATANYSKRTFTLRIYFNNHIYKKFRTDKMTVNEFNDAVYYTSNDWKSFLNDSCSYYMVNDKSI